MDAPNLPALSSIDDFIKHEYDFLVVGGGTAGLVVAARLTENPNIHVGVLEAGQALIGDPMIMMPAMYVKTIGDPKYDWLHKSTPQVEANNSVKDIARGKCLGGSSAINYQMYVRGHAGDYDDWAKLGNKGWGFQDLLPYFKKHEHFDEPANYAAKFNIPLETKYDPDYHGRDGPIHTSFSTFRIPLEQDWIAAATALRKMAGSPMEPWSGDHLGIFHSLSTIDRSTMTGTRSYATTGYFIPNATRPNLHVLTEALVTKLIVLSDGTITGVEFIHSEKTHTVPVKKEVVLSAGVIKSPQVLELSGIGDKTVLSKAGVKCIVENPLVGEHLQDHPCSGFGYELVEGEKTLDMLQDPAVLQEAIVEYTTNQSGPLANSCSTMGFVSFADLSSPSEISAIQASIMDGKSTNGLELDKATRKAIADGLGKPSNAGIQFILLPSTLNFKEADSQVKLYQPPPEQLGKHGLVLIACIARPLSVGSCHITTNSVHNDPAIDPGYLTHPADIDVLVKGLRFLEKMVSTPPLKEKIRKRYAAPGVDLSTDKALKEFIRGQCASEYHLIGTVCMGVEGVGACDDRLKLRGCKGLRVVDASVIPVHVSGNILATVYALAEKGADLIKEDWGL